jgi:hypothetical protein
MQFARLSGAQRCVPLERYDLAALGGDHGVGELAHFAGACCDQVLALHERGVT